MARLQQVRGVRLAVLELLDVQGLAGWEARDGCSQVGAQAVLPGEARRLSQQSAMLQHDLH